MCLEMLNQYRYNHTVSSKYAFSALGFDLFQATYESSLPRRPIKITFGKWFIEARIFRWQVLINKMTKQQLERRLASKLKDKQDSNKAFGNPTFGY